MSDPINVRDKLTLAPDVTNPITTENASYKILDVISVDIETPQALTG